MWAKRDTCGPYGLAQMGTGIFREGLKNQKPYKNLGSIFKVQSLQLTRLDGSAHTG